MGTAIEEERRVLLAPVSSPAAFHTLAQPSLTPLDEQAKALELHGIPKSAALLHFQEKLSR